MSLIERIKKARESNVEIDGITFTTRRPTDYEAINKILERVPGKDDFQLKASSKYLLENFVVGWVGLNECDLVPGGSPEPVPFTAEVFMAWAEDNLDVWPILSKAIVESYLSHHKAQDEDLGKPEPG